MFVHQLEISYGVGQCDRGDVDKKLWFFPHSIKFLLKSHDKIKDHLFFPKTEYNMLYYILSKKYNNDRPK